MNKTEAFIITTAVALALVPRFEARVQSYVREHHTEIQMAVNQLQGKPPMPFAIDDSAPKTELAFNNEASPTVARTAASFRSGVIAARGSAKAAERVEFAALRPQLAQLRLLAARNMGAYRFYRLKAKDCPQPPSVPAIPAARLSDVEAGSLP